MSRVDVRNVSRIYPGLDHPAVVLPQLGEMFLFDPATTKQLVQE